MHFKYKSPPPELGFQHPLVLSAGGHLGVLATAFFVIFGPDLFLPYQVVDLTVIDVPKSAAPLTIAKKAKPKTKPKVKKRAVFGASRKSVTAKEGIAVKKGNTVAKAPDKKVLRKNDVDSLPIPVEEYLVTNMPQIEYEFRVPYPPQSKKAAIEGAVVMDILIDSRGNVRDVKLVQGPAPDLNAAAMAAVRKFRFKPAEIEKKRVPVKIRYSYRFVLEN